MSTCLPASLVKAEPNTDLLIIPKVGSNVSSSFILRPSSPTVVAEDNGSITIPILLIADLSGDPDATNELSKISLLILYPVPDAADRL